jgi:hypothetical protein
VRMRLREPRRLDPATRIRSDAAICLGRIEDLGEKPEPLPNPCWREPLPRERGHPLSNIGRSTR